jgi:hypothetical protein
MSDYHLPAKDFRKKGLMEMEKARTTPCKRRSGLFGSVITAGKYPFRDSDDAKSSPLSVLPLFNGT